MKKNKKIAIGIFSTIVVIAGGIILAKKIVSSSSSDSTFYVVRKETYENVIEIAGTVSAAKSQSLMSRNDGTVVGVYKKEGDEVKSGDLIVQLDDTEQLYNLANTNYEIGVARISQTAGKLNLLLAQRKSLVQKVADRKITATFDGIIASLDVDPGDYLEAKDSVGTLVDTSYLTAEVEIAETDVSKLKVGQKVEFTFPAYDGTVEGYVVSYPTIGEVTSRGATVVKAKVRIDDVPAGILPNFSFTGKIQITEPEEKLIVERYAIGHEQGNSFVEIIEGDGKTVKVEVKVEPYTTEYVNIISGLEGGERLKAQSSAEKSGRLRTFKKGEGGKSNKNKNQNGGPGGFGGPPF
ncbi:efflux RND transporter periplasmic adaptor subunit [Treponema zioleckii]|uniref:efflux RND transporter periplasmic adaptor subunit n=1 Tax=Treponema zioleckii TaxID=331680 RepID=UPI00168AF23F|nr:HlyD family efflux transporter periplasmic adaptor subunit [Treponema zioleckii]